MMVDLYLLLLLQSSTAIVQVQPEQAAPVDRTGIDQTAPMPSEDARRAPLAKPERALPDRQQIDAPAPANPQMGQLSSSGQSTVADRSISRASDGRTTATTVPDGPDRCDVDADGAAARPICDHVIETRAADFRPAPRRLFSAEETLLSENSALARGRSPIEAARTAGQGADASDGDDQVLAALTLNNPVAVDQRPDGDRPDPTGLSPETQAFIEALVNGLSQGGVPR